MRCPFCAEEIQSEAVLCRYCGALKTNGTWKPPARPWMDSAAPAAKGSTTIRVAGACFLLSAVWEVYCLGEGVPLFGAVRVGSIAVVYHLLYTALFATMGVGLLIERYWGYQAVLAGTLVYTLDKVAFMLDRTGMEAYLASQLKGNPEVLELVDRDSILQLTVAFTLVVLVCWLGFTLYLHLRRDRLRR